MGSRSVERGWDGIQTRMGEHDNLGLEQKKKMKTKIVTEESSLSAGKTRPRQKKSVLYGRESVGKLQLERGSRLIGRPVSGKCLAYGGLEFICFNGREGERGGTILTSRANCLISTDGTFTGRGRWETRRVQGPMVHRKVLRDNPKEGRKRSIELTRER